MNYRKRENILWALTGSGIVIQNLDTNVFLILNETQERVWAYIDGTNSMNQLIEYIYKESDNISYEQASRIVEETVKILRVNSLIVGNNHDIVK